MPTLRAFTAILLLCFSGPAYANETAGLRTELQATMQRHIDQLGVNGVIRHLDLKTATLIDLFPTEAHPMILVGEGFYVLCADLVDAAGQSYPADFYMISSDHGIHVFRTEIDNRRPLKALLDIGGVNEL